MLNQKVTARLVEKAAVSLVMWNLCRRGIECLPTSTNSDQGDIWAKLPGGQIVSVEVKGSSGTSWHIRAGQTRRSDWFLFVSIHDARCWVVPKAKMPEVLAAGHHREGIVTLPRTSMPAGSLDDWWGIAAKPIKITLTPRGPRAPAVYAREKMVRKRLADGTVKEYRYGPSQAE